MNFMGMLGQAGKFLMNNPQLVQMGMQAYGMDQAMRTPSFDPSYHGRVRMQGLQNMGSSLVQGQQFAEQQKIREEAAKIRKMQMELLQQKAQRETAQRSAYEQAIPQLFPGTPAPPYTGQLAGDETDTDIASYGTPAQPDPRASLLSALGPEAGASIIGKMMIPKDPPAGFTRTPGGGLAPIPGGPADPGYLAGKTAATARAPDQVQQYQLAREQGYKGSFTEWKKDLAKAGRPQNIGSIPQGYQLTEGADGSYSMSPIPGSEAARKAAEAQVQRDRSDRVGAESGAEGAKKVFAAIKGAREALGASTPAAGTMSRPFALFAETPAGRLRSNIKEIKSEIALGAIQRLKEASKTGATGFGAMNAAELDLLINEAGALDPDETDPAILKRTLDRIENRYKRVIENVRKTVPPEAIKQWGLTDLIGNPDGGDDEKQRLRRKYGLE